MHTISWLDQDRGRQDVGGKAATLSALLRAGFPVPNGFVITVDGWLQHLQHHGLAERLGPLEASGGARVVRRALDVALPEELAAQVLEAWRQLGGGPVAVRSSSTVEDLPQFSAAGQLDSFLNVHGADELLAAVRGCYASLWSDRAVAYRRQHQLDDAEARVAVLVQLMAPAEAAGVMFTANPLTGRREETLVTANLGLGEHTAEGDAADTFVVRDRQVSERRLVTKRTRTVSDPEGQGTIEVRVRGEQATGQAIDDGQVLALAELGARVADFFGGPQDIEWVITDGQPVVVQARPVTVLPEPIGEVPDDWEVPDEKGMYARSAFTDLLPDPLSPLFADLLLPQMPEAMCRVLRRHLDEDVLREGEVEMVLVNGYAYYHHSHKGLRRLLTHGSRTLTALRGRSPHDPETLATVAEPAHHAVLDAWRGREVATMPSHELLRGTQELLGAACEHYSWLQACLPLASSSELPFARLYTGLAKQIGGPSVNTFLRGYETHRVRRARSLRALAEQVRQYPELTAAILEGREADELEGMEGLEQAREAFARHLAEHPRPGRNLDLCVPLDSEDPTRSVQALLPHLDGEAPDPDEELARRAEEREQATQDLFQRLDPARRAILQPLLEKAQAATPAREDALVEVVAGWPLMRRMMLELGRRLVDVGALQQAGDVFWLHLDEARELADHLDAFGGHTHSRNDLVQQRRTTWRGQRSAEAPALLPRHVWNRMFTRFVPAMESHQRGPVIKGFGVSQGRITGPARIIRGPQDFETMRPGEVIVSPATTPAWTPLFATAAALVTDVGGPLSHSSIVAREHGIPAVLGTGIATRRIRNGMLVTVDADRGSVTMPEGEDPIETGFRPKVPYKFAMGGAAAALALVLRKML
ncbi:PEP/pyruvate-binding domain-containing protein [Luteococcus sp.]|uniref:PEP/pyruvate-binding domain-containing protein n=1 Tax=Luteococcus sp. TaxID=1969402 RepID=UPI003735A723